MAASSNDNAPTLNEDQREAATHDDRPLLIIAGAGTGKTQTLAHRVAELIARGANPRRILLLTFTRRAAAEMIRRAVRLLGARVPGRVDLPWAGTFHAIGAQLLRLHARAAGLDPQFTILDREDSADLLDRLRHELGLTRTDKRFPRKGTCLAIYSRVVNTGLPLKKNLEDSFPWCAEWEEPLTELFASYVEAKLTRQVLDYDDLLLYWAHLMRDEQVGARMAATFDHVLVDEYQDTNALQAEIVRLLSPTGRGVTVVGDDAQAIYSFRAASVRNILDFPAQYTPPAVRITLTQNYRSTAPILSAANAVMGLASERFAKDLFSRKPGGEPPGLVTCADETEQVQFVVETILAKREQGVPLRQQAVLFRAAHHSAELEIELGRRNIPFVKYGGLRFIESAHVKDVVCTLRWAENPRDSLAAFRVVQLLPGFGPSFADRVLRAVEEHGFALASTLAAFSPPAAALASWAAFSALYARLTDQGLPWGGQLGLVRHWYEPHLERLYDDAAIRRGDLEQLELLAGSATTRERFLADLTLDPPEGSGVEAGPPHLDEDYLVLSTIHSAKGQEWDSVYVLNAADGCIPSDMATATVPQIEEERRLLYVAMTRAKNALFLVHPLRFFIRQQSRYGDRHVFTPRTRFIPDELLPLFRRTTPTPSQEPGTGLASPVAARAAVDIAGRLRAMWRTA